MGLAILLDKLLAKRVITGRGTTDPYLTKYRLLDLGRHVGRLHLHRFHRSDEDPECHSHPWSWALSLVLWGGYEETLALPVPGAPPLLRFGRKRRPGAFNLIRRDTWHRVDLLRGECWTLFLSGPIPDHAPGESSWGFLDLVTSRVIPWRQFLADKGGTVPDGAYWREKREA